MHVRPATHDDLQATLDIYNDAVLTTTASYDEQPRTIEQRTAWFDNHMKHGYPVFVAVDADGKVVGWSSLSHFHDRPGFRFTAENSVYVAASHRGRGIGTLLMPPLLTAAQGLGLRAIIAAIDSDNEASIRLHIRFGFEKVGHFKQVGFKFGRWLDVVYLEKLFA